MLSTVLEPLRDPYQLAQILFIGSIVTAVSELYYNTSDRSVQTYFDNQFQSKFGTYLQYIFLTIVLGLIPVSLADFIFSGFFEYPVYQGIASSLLISWYVIHQKVNDWKMTNFKTIYEFVIVVGSLLILIVPKL